MIDQNPQANALKWLLEMEMMADPNIFNSIVLNIFRVSKYIKDVQFITDNPRKKLLIYIEIDVGWFFKKSRTEKLKQALEELLGEILPSYKKRIVFDEHIFTAALKLVGGAK